MGGVRLVKMQLEYFRQEILRIWARALITRREKSQMSMKVCIYRVWTGLSNE